MDLSLVKSIENNGNILTFADSDSLTDEFLRVMMRFIIDYPIVWKNFVENVLKNCFAINYEGLLAIIYAKFLPNNIQIVIDHTLDYVKRSGIIETIKNDDGVYYISFHNEAQKTFFSKTGIWLEYFTYYTLLEIFDGEEYDVHISQGNLIRFGNTKKYREIDVLGSYGGRCFIIECKDTNSYSEDDYKKLRRLAKQVYNKEAKKIFVTTKHTKDDRKKSEKYGIEFVVFSGDYYLFKEDLINALTI